MPQSTGKIPGRERGYHCDLPPYNFGQNYADDPHDDTQDWDAILLNASYTIWGECARVLKPGGRMCRSISSPSSLIISRPTTYHLLPAASRETFSGPPLEGRDPLGEEQLIMPNIRPGGAGVPPPCPTSSIPGNLSRSLTKETHKKAGLKKDIDITDEEFKEWVIGKWSIPPRVTRIEEDQATRPCSPKRYQRRLLKLFSYSGGPCPRSLQRGRDHNTGCLEEPQEIYRD